MSIEQVSDLIDMYNNERKENKRLKEEIEKLKEQEKRYFDTIAEDTITIHKLKKQIKGLFEDCKVDIENLEDKPIFLEMQRCLRELLDLSIILDEEDLQKGYRTAICKNIPPKIDEKYFDLIFKKRGVED